MYSFVATYHTDIGIKKETNQDALLIKKAQTPNGEVLLTVICDGMGGLQKGEVASAEVIQAFSGWFYHSLPGILEQGQIPEAIEQQWTELIIGENEKIKSYGEACGAALGTTVTAMFFHEREYYIIHVGDSRAYWIENDVFQLTEDQTVVAREVARGIITPEQAKEDPRRNVLLQCVGASEHVVPQFLKGSIMQRSNYLLCSDGFRHEITPQEIYNVLNPQTAVDEESMHRGIVRLIEENKIRQERDNISAIMIKAE